MGKNDNRLSINRTIIFSFSFLFFVFLFLYIVVCIEKWRNIRELMFKEGGRSKIGWRGCG